ncbi:MAG: FAD-dependent oxidoreductase [Actinomycetota bacterium]
MGETVDVAIIGGGQAGLATSHELSQRGIEHVVLERGRVGQTWRTRWDSFCLVTPNWSVRLPGYAYDGSDPDGFMPRDEIVAYLERYATATGTPIREDVDVTSLSRNGDASFLLRTSNGNMNARAVVVAAGAYQRPHRPDGAGSLPARIPQIDVEDYVNPSHVPEGEVLIVGSGQSGCQVAEELVADGREVYLACGRAPWLPRRIGEHDLFWWALETGFLDQTVDKLPAPTARLSANVLATGRDGGHDLNLRTLRAAGVTLLGHLLGATDGRAHFANDLAESVAWGDDRYRDLMGLVRKLVAERSLEMPPIVEPEPFSSDAPSELDLSRIGIVTFAGGYRPNYGAWVDMPGAFDEFGFPIHSDGESFVAPGLFFVGVHFLRTRKSSLLCGVGDDARVIATRVAAARSD